LRCVLNSKLTLDSWYSLSNNLGSVLTTIVCTRVSGHTQS